MPFQEPQIWISFPFFFFFSASHQLTFGTMMEASQRECLFQVWWWTGRKETFHHWRYLPNCVLWCQKLVPIICWYNQEFYQLTSKTTHWFTNSICSNDHCKERCFLLLQNFFFAQGGTKHKETKCCSGRYWEIHLPADNKNTAAFLLTWSNGDHQPQTLTGRQKHSKGQEFFYLVLSAVARKC